MYLDKIIMHHSLTNDGDTKNWDAIRKYHKGLGWDDIGYHYGIELIAGEYEILTGRLLDTPGAHTKGQNKSSLGICLVGNFDLAKPPKPQWDLAVRLVQSLCETIYITASSVYGHNEFAEKSCPGEKFNMNLFKRNVRERR